MILYFVSFVLSHKVFRSKFLIDFSQLRWLSSAPASRVLEMTGEVVSTAPLLGQGGAGVVGFDTAELPPLFLGVG
ncbi:hypothetical protein A3841_19695 [Pontibacter flavimaris]|uniref:Uncharacterized protein n=1 Tax=Pontibacter flavimaris TaxID=1797110 RepID=A0A1Q5PEA5_9BACT|nr:hypothetical protein A3841_19695 [Pontibacter flavimaris]